VRAGTERNADRLKSGRLQSSILPVFQPTTVLRSLFALFLLAAGMMAGTAWGGQKGTGGTVTTTTIGGNSTICTRSRTSDQTRLLPVRISRPEYLVVGGGGVAAKATGVALEAAPAV